MKTPNSQMQEILDVPFEMNSLPIESLTAEQARLMPLPDRSAFVWYQPYISRIYADLAGLLPATIINAEIDPLLNAGQNYANKLGAASAPVAYKMYEGVTHEFFGLAGLVGEATDAVAFACKNLKNAFEREP